MLPRQARQVQRQKIAVNQGKAQLNIAVNFCTQLLLTIPPNLKLQIRPA
jgi:hypothetical protein